MTERQRLNEPFIAWCDRQCVKPDSDAWSMFEDAHSIGELTADSDAGRMLVAICDMLELPRTDQGGFCTDLAAYDQAIKALSHVPPAEQARKDEARRKRELALIRFAHQLDIEGEEAGTGYPIAETVLKRFNTGEGQ